jgi:hypothetical protein
MRKSTKLQWKIEAVRRLHLPYTDWDSCCGTCFGECGDDEDSVLCQVCETEYPCLTMLVLGEK